MIEDREVWHRICDGDVAAFDDLYRKQAPRLYLFLRRITGNRQAAEDLVQETFTQFWEKPGKYDPDFGRIGSWLFGIARKRAAGWWRKHDAGMSEAEEPISDCHLETSSALWDAMTRLDPHLQLILWLREVEGQSYEELAAILEIPIGTVRSRLFAAREALRTIWHQDPPGTSEPSQKGGCA